MYVIPHLKTTKLILAFYGGTVCESATSPSSPTKKFLDETLTQTKYFSYSLLTFEHVPPFRQGESAHVSGTQEGNGVQLVVCEQLEPHVPAEQMTRY